jgi:hypothetical protein
MFDIRITQDYLCTVVILTVSHPDGTIEYEGVGSNLGEALAELSAEYSDRTGE